MICFAKHQVRQEKRDLQKDNQHDDADSRCYDKEC